MIWRAAVILLMLVNTCHSRDLGQWKDSDNKEWFSSLMQPDNPKMSCCGEADGYWCDEYHVRDEKFYCTVTDDRDDLPLRRPHIPVGTEIEIPPNKIGRYPGNPTGHSYVFVSSSPSHYVWCFVQLGGT